MFKLIDHEKAERLRAQPGRVVVHLAHDGARCRCCARLLHDGEDVLLIHLEPTAHRPRGRRAFLHLTREECDGKRDDGDAD